LEENQQAAQELKELVTTKGWLRLQDHLAKHLTQKERVKAEAIRQAKDSDVRLLQGFIDGINFVVSEPLKLTRLYSQESEI